ncbi:MAG: hypothetical protein GX178_03770 [Acidobacteria bacterium]|jgi:hypothetical protein|nr:hypothetical protein [Thermoanaerobaculia bacterium]MDI9632415.1 hypothetical protein [Acidobacteriota bacterium]OQC39429.1 MAG: hypothetical protein BWX64_01634 [Acidobacteria bacterium ADurb.Bin051]MBP7814451.1 hypothetical protein [Thermoanaerobaculia bacterium]MBP8845839.1 hypothetical protein [Thermoanaerobaculia bacterium]
MIRPNRSQHLIFDPTAEIFATDSGGGFVFPLLVDGNADVDTEPYDEVRFVFSVWHPSGQKTIDLDRAYLELQGAFDPDEDHWTKLAEIEPVVAPYGGGETFDGWIVLPVMAARSAWALVGNGFEPRTRIQIRASAYLVS